MKKFIVACISIITMMLCMAQPLFVHAEYSGSLNTEPEAILEDYWTTNQEWLDSWRHTPLTDITSRSDWGLNEDSYFLYFKSFVLDNYYFTNALWFDSADVSFTDNVLTISNAVNGTIYCRNWYKGNGSDTYVQLNSFTNCSIDFENRILTGNFDRAAEEPLYGIWDIYSNIPDFLSSPPSLNLSVSFSPSMSGTVTRKGTANGSEVTYDHLNLNIQNNGDNAQWLFCIVPHGQSLSFPEAIINTPQGFIGSPTYVYIADEWIDWTNGLTGITGNYGGIDMQMLYSPCAWHTLITQSDRTYRINWDMMKLSKDVSYDCVVYGMINEEPVNASSSGSGLGCWTVKSALSGIQEVYRSTFTMANPAEFNPNSIDEGNSSHSWDPDIDNSDLFNSNSVYKDSNGNFVIKGGSSNSNSSGGSFYVSSSSVNNINNIFRNFFRFISGVLICFPTIYQNIIALGLSALIVVGVVKVAIK